MDIGNPVRKVTVVPTRHPVPDDLPEEPSRAVPEPTAPVKEPEPVDP